MCNNSFKYLVLYLFISLIVSSSINFGLIIVNDKIFLEPIQFDVAQKTISEEDFDSTRFSREGSEPIELNIEWPWYSLIFYYGIYLAYWFIFGKVSCVFLKRVNIKVLLIVPLLTGLMYMDLFFPFYLLAAYIGGLRRTRG